MKLYHYNNCIEKIKYDITLEYELKLDKIKEDFNKQINNITKNSELIGDDFKESDLIYIKSLQNCKQSFVITNPNLPDNPIVFCTDGFCELTGYERYEILGKNCRFLQGPESNKDAIEIIKKSIANGTKSFTCLKNYKKDGTEFLNCLTLSHLKDSNNNVLMTIGIQHVV
jgi:PAS domain S-box-containing protein